MRRQTATQQSKIRSTGVSFVASDLWHTAAKLSGIGRRRFVEGRGFTWASASGCQASSGSPNEQSPWRAFAEISRGLREKEGKWGGFKDNLGYCSSRVETQLAGNCSS
ncbi:hypothetical protein TorRG33x02_314690, partial [Trema orientale]